MLTSLNLPRAARMLLALAVVGAMATGLRAQDGEAKNLALNKRATISSYQTPWCATANPTGANDGNLKKFDKNMGYGFHTKGGDKQWWKVDLGGTFEIGTITITNRQDHPDAYQARAKNLEVYWSADDVSYNLIPRPDESDKKSFDKLTLNINNGQGVKARYVKVELNDGNPLHLAQVEVFEKLQMKAPDPSQLGIGSGQDVQNPFGNM